MLVHLWIIRIATGVVCAQPCVGHGRVFPEARSAGGYRRHSKGILYKKGDWKRAAKGTID
jgi:hypothetical protein